jgi:flagellar motility protein MotE (MotC chaperone)
MTASEALERLYAVSPRDFTRTRNNLAAELRHARNADAARAVAGLRRPSAPLWAINQLGRHARAPLERFLDAVERLRHTQLSDPRAAMEAMRTERTQLEALVTRAEEALRAERYGASAATRRRIGDTLLGAAADRRHADALLHGRLTQELEAPGFDALTAAPPRLRVVQGGARHEPGASRQSQRQAAAEERRRQREAAADARRRAAEARRHEAETRRREAAEQAAAVAALQREAAAARERLADIERRLKQARRRAR